MKKILLIFTTLLMSTLIFGCGTNTNTNESTKSHVAEDRAKEIALTHANIAKDDASFDRVELDKDQGQDYYEIEFHVGNLEYDYEIDAKTGEIISYEHGNETGDTTP